MRALFALRQDGGVLKRSHSDSGLGVSLDASSGDLPHAEKDDKTSRGTFTFFDYEYAKLPNFNPSQGPTEITTLGSVRADDVPLIPVPKIELPPRKPTLGPDANEAVPVSIAAMNGDGVVKAASIQEREIGSGSEIGSSSSGNKAAQKISKLQSKKLVKGNVNAAAKVEVHNHLLQRGTEFEQDDTTMNVGLKVCWCSYTTPLFISILFFSFLTFFSFL